jgi:hypothetical protein
VTTAKINDSAVTAAKIADGTITSAKLASGVSVAAETTRTVSIAANSNAATIQAALDGIAKYIPYGVTVTVQFADGTYTLSTSINIQGFYGGGDLIIQGNTAEANATVKHTTQSVILDASGQVSSAVLVRRNSVVVTFRNFKVKWLADNTNNYYGIWVGENGMRANVYYNYFEASNNTTYSDAVASTFSSINLYRNYMKTGYSAMDAWSGGFIYSNDNDYITTQPLYGMSVAGGEISKVTGVSQPTGSTAASSTLYGGEIR